MFDAQCDVAALVYETDDDPDALLRDFAAEVNADGIRAIGMIQAGQCADFSLSAVLIHNGETLLLAQDPEPNGNGCRLDLARLSKAGERVAAVLDHGADLLIVNRFGKREANGRGLAYLIDRALEADAPVIIAVSSEHFADWLKFSGGMSVKIRCDRQALETWWKTVSRNQRRFVSQKRETMCAVFK